MTGNWTKILAQLAPERRRAMEFLWEHLPRSDVDCYPPELFVRFADHALHLRRQAPWCAALEPEIFHYYVLFPRVNDEDLSFHRALFYEELWPRIAGLPTVEEKVLEVNRWCHEHATYQAQDSRTASPLTVFRNGSGRCGEESGFLVSALRSVGIPARQVYVPRWAHCDDNHAWVEALCGGQWHFLGACEPEPVLDKGWFNTPASRAMLVVSRIFGEGTSPLHGACLGQTDGVYWYNQTPRYARTRRYTFRVLAGGAPAAGAQIRLQLLNEANFCTIATLTADSRGEAEAVLGLGSLHVLAVWNGLRAEGDCADGSITLHLLPPETADTPWTEFDVYAPEAAPVHPAVLDAAQRARRAAVLQAGDARRKARLASFQAPPGKSEAQETLRQTDSKRNGSAMPGKSGAQETLLRQALGNRAEIAAFLERDGDPRREALLRTLPPKDLRDAEAETLENHLRHTGPAGTLPPEIYERYVLCPRVELERLTPWRGALRGALPPEQAAACRAEPAALWALLCGRIRTDGVRNYGNLVWTPAEAWRAGRCNVRSLRILYVALLRALGVPARLRPLDGEPEFWRDGAFRPVDAGQVAALPVRAEESGGHQARALETGQAALRVHAEESRAGQAGTLPLHAGEAAVQPAATLCLACEGGPAPVYEQNWTLARQTPEGWQLLSLPAGCGQQRAWELALPAGRYRLTTAVRLPNGNQFAARREVALRPGETKHSGLCLRAYRLEDMLRRQPLAPVPAVTLKGEAVQDACRMDGRPALLFWLEEGGEPTEHVLNELAAAQAALEALPVRVVFLLRGRESLRQPTLAGLLARWPGVTVLLDEWEYDLEQAARQLTCDPSAPPLAVACDARGRAAYGISGYHVGSVELLARIAALLCEEADTHPQEQEDTRCVK